MPKADILARLRESFKTESATLAGETVTVREMSAAQSDAYRLGMVEIDASGKRTIKYENYQVRLVAACLVDAEGETFSEADLSAIPAGALEPLFVLAQRLNGLQPDGQEIAEGN